MKRKHFKSALEASVTNWMKSYSLNKTYVWKIFLKNLNYLVSTKILNDTGEYSLPPNWNCDICDWLLELRIWKIEKTFFINKNWENAYLYKVKVFSLNDDLEMDVCTVRNGYLIFLRSYNRTLWHASWKYKYQDSKMSTWFLLQL